MNGGPERTGAAQGIAQEVTNERDLALGICCCSKTIPHLIPFSCEYIWRNRTHGEERVRIKPTHTQKKRLGWGVTTTLTACLVFKIYRHRRLGTRICYFQTRRDLIWPSDGTMSRSTPSINLLDDLKLVLLLPKAPFFNPRTKERGFEFLTLAWPTSVIG